MTQAKPDVTHIVMASRGYSRDEERNIEKMFARDGMKGWSVDASMVQFEGKADIRDADRRVAEKLKELFSHHLPKPEVVDDDDAFGVDGDDFDMVADGGLKEDKALDGDDS